jgi:hypothetical protein
MTTQTLHAVRISPPAGARKGRRWLEAALVVVNSAIAVILIHGMLVWDSAMAIWLAPGALLRILAAFGMWQGWRARWSFQVASGLWLVLLGCLLLFVFPPDSCGGG